MDIKINKTRNLKKYILFSLIFISSLFFIKFSDYTWSRYVNVMLLLPPVLTNPRALVYLSVYIVLGIFLVFTGMCIMMLPLQKRENTLPFLTRFVIRLESIKFFSLHTITLIAGVFFVVLGVDLLFNIGLLIVFWPIAQKLIHNALSH